MKNHPILADLSKFGAGLVLYDLLFGVWIAVNNFYYLNLFGIDLTPSLVNLWIAMDIIFLILLIHYGWRVELRPITSTRRWIFATIGSLLSVIAILHLARLAFSVTIIVDGVYIPLWLSVIGTVVAAFLAYCSFHLAVRRK